LYRDEFDEWHGMGAVDVRRAFSRVEGAETEARGCRRVQDRLWHDREEVKGLWECGARVYVCGSRLMGEGIKRVMGKIVLGRGATEDEVAQWYKSVRKDLYATNMFD
jgi:cytochrome P450/NADPH-cytochrome P450 reductase